jgi:hypothetical protein
VLIVVVSWLVVIFVGFSVIAPRNATAILAFMLAAFAVSGAIFLILELASQCATHCNRLENRDNQPEWARNVFRS